MLRFVILTICQRSGWCCCDWLYFRPFAREVVHVVVVIFDHLPEKWFMLWWLFLTICQSGSYSCGCFYFVVDNLPEELFIYCGWLFLTICKRSGSCCSAISDIIFNLMMAVSIGMTHAFIKTISLKKERNWCLNHVNILSGSKVMTKNRHQNLYTFWTDLSKWPPNCKILKI